MTLVPAVVVIRRRLGLKGKEQARVQFVLHAVHDACGCIARCTNRSGGRLRCSSVARPSGGLNCTTRGFGCEAARGGDRQEDDHLPLSYRRQREDDHPRLASRKLLFVVSLGGSLAEGSRLTGKGGCCLGSMGTLALFRHDGPAQATHSLNEEAPTTKSQNA